MEKTSDEDTNKQKEKDKDKEKKEEQKKKEKEEKINTIAGVVKEGIDLVKTILNYKLKDKEIEQKGKLESLEKESQKEEYKQLMKEFKEFKEIQKKRDEDEKQKRETIVDGNKNWNNEKKKLIDSILSEINYLDLIEDTFSSHFQDFKSQLEETISKIINDDLKNKPLIQQEHNLIFRTIKNDIPKIETLNFMIVGVTGVEKSCLTNALLQFDKAVESGHIKPQTIEFERFENPNIPGITIYDTVGVEHYNQQNKLDEIKNKIKSIFADNLKEKTSLHGILYCRSFYDVRIEKGEIEFIQELNNLYGNSDILTIVFTKAEDEEENETMEELRKELNNNGIDIIKVNSKKIIKKIYGNQEIPIPQFGIDKLKKLMIKNAEKVVKANLKYSAKITIKEKYILNTKENFNEMEKKFKNHEFGNITQECETIIKNLFTDLNFNYEDLNLNFGKLERDISDYIEQLNIKIKKKYIDKYKDKGLNKLFEAFSNFNNKYDNQLNDSSMKEHFYIKFDDFFETKIIEEINKEIVGKAFQIFMQKSRDIFSEMVSDNVTDEEIKDPLNINLEILKKKFNNQ